MFNMSKFFKFILIIICFKNFFAEINNNKIFEEQKIKALANISAIKETFDNAFSGSSNSENSKISTYLKNSIASSGKEIVSELSKGISEGISNSFSNSFKEKGDFDKTIDAFSGATQRNLKKFSKELTSSIGEVANDAGKEMQNTFKAGSEIDKGFKEGTDLFKRNVNDLIQELVHKNLFKSAGIGIGFFASYFLLQNGIPFMFKIIERIYTRPKLIIESSKKGLSETIKSFFFKKDPVQMIFEPGLEKRLNKLIDVTIKIQKKIKKGKKNVKYRNLMLYGLPGTGKTFFAKELARRSGLEYVFMSGSSFYKFKEGEGIEALDELFSWANKSKNGLLIFIDEAETFLSERKNMDPQSRSYQLLNNFLNYTGERSNKFMIVFATNHKDALDSAMYRRIDDLVEVKLPTFKERVKVLELYKEQFLTNPKDNDKTFIDSVKKVFTKKIIEDIANKTEGFSPAEIQGIINNIKTDSSLLEPEVLTEEIIYEAVEYAIEKHENFYKKKIEETIKKEIKIQEETEIEKNLETEL